MNLLQSKEHTYDILEKSNIGLWAIELEAGMDPRMYGDRTMLSLLGVEEELTPEQVYYAWKKNIESSYIPSIEKTVQHLLSGEHTEVEYIWIHPKTGPMYVRCGGILTINRKELIRVEGIHYDVSELYLIKKQYEQQITAMKEAQENESDIHHLIPALTDDFECLIYVRVFENPLNDTVVNYRISEQLSKTIHGWKDTFTFRDKLIMLGRIMPQKDHDFFMKEVNRDTVFEKLKTEDSVSITFRLIIEDELVYYQMKFFPDKSKGKLKGYVVGIRNIDREIQEQLLYEKQLEQQQTVIATMSEDFAYVCFVDAKTLEENSYHFDEKLLSLFPRWHDIHNFKDRLELINNHMVLADDHKMFMERTSSDVILKKIAENHAYFVNYRAIINGQIQYWQIKFVLPKDTEDQIVVGFRSIDEQVRSQEAASYEKERYTDITKSLSTDFERIYYVDINTEDYDEYVTNSTSKAVSESEGNGLKKTGHHFFQESLTYFKSHMTPEEFKKLSSFFKKKTLLATLEKKRTTSLDYKLQTGSRAEWNRLKVLKPSEESTHIIFAVANVDKEVREHMDYQNTLERNLAIIDILASEYSSVYYINLENEDLIPYTMNADTKNEFGIIFNRGISFSDAFRLYVDRLIYEPDREMMLQAGSIETITRNLRNSKSYVTIYRSDNNGQIQYCEMKFVKVGDENEAPKAVALAFANRDQEILNRYIDSKLYQDFTAIYMVNAENDTIRTVVSDMNPELQKYQGRGVYSQWISDFSELVEDEYQETWKKMCDPKFMQEYLSETDKREYTYRTRRGKWGRCTCFSLERRNGVCMSFFMTFILLDDASSEKYELDHQIAEQKRILEEQQVQLESALKKAEAASRAKTTFLSNMSHDIRTPMNAIMGFTNLAMDSTDMDKVQGYLSKTAISSRHLLSLINDVLDMSRIESGKLQIEEGPCSLPEIVHDLNTLILTHAREKEQAFTIELNGVEDEDIISDKLRLHQVFINLLSNAVKYTPVHGRIQFIIKQTGSSRTEATYEFRVKDNGIGMSSEFKDKIFDPFERERNTTMSKVQGTGLGMSIAKNIIDLMNGTIRVESESAKGSEFIVNLTFKLQGARVKYKPVRKLQGTRVLIVCKDHTDSLQVHNTLSSFGLKPETAVFGQEARQLVDSAISRKEPYGLFFIDCDLPDMKGIDLVKHIRTVAGSSVPVIMASYDWLNNMKEVQDLNISATVEKPFFVSSVYRALSETAGVQAEKKPVMESGKSLKGKRILLVEDNELNRDIAKDILQGIGVIIDTAENGFFAYEKIRSSQPDAYDIILMDVQMPVMDGYEATRKIRELPDERFRKIPIIAMTANAFSEDRTAALEAGMNDHVAKPIDIALLKETLFKYL